MANLPLLNGRGGEYLEHAEPVRAQCRILEEPPKQPCPSSPATLRTAPGLVQLAPTSQQFGELPTAVRQRGRCVHAGLEVAEFALGDGLGEIAGTFFSLPLLNGYPPLLNG